MSYILDTGSLEAIKLPPGAQLKRIPKETVQLAEELQSLETLITTRGENGNAELIIKLKVVRGKLGRFFQLAGKWFPWG